MTRGSQRGLIGVVVLLAVAGAIGFRRSSRPEPPSYKTTAVERGAIAARVTATGVLSALVTVQVGSQVSGRIQELHVDYNSPVKKGDLIAKIDPQLYAAALEQARANDLAARAGAIKAEAQALDASRQYNRNKALRDRNLISQADLDSSETNLAAANAQVEVAKGAVAQARASRHQAEVNLGYTEIRSPIKGVVISRSVDVGQTVAASLQAPTLFTIAEDLRKMQVDTSVAESDIGKLKPGMAASFRVDAYPGETFRGVIRQLRNAAQTLQNVVTYDAVIDVDNVDLRLKPGMTANVTIIHDKREDTLKLANTALRFRLPPELTPKGTRTASLASDQRTVWVLRGSDPIATTIRIGLNDGSFTEVREGLRAGMQVLTEARTSAKSGMPPGGAPNFRRL